MVLLRLFFEFFKAGLFAIGGGLATIPFLYEISEKTGWFTQAELLNMIAVSESTPGPIGVNMATYVGNTVGTSVFGNTAGGLLGGFIATMGLIAPSLIIILIIVVLLDKFRNNKYVDSAFKGLRPASVGLIAASGASVAVVALLNTGLWKETGSLIDLFNWKCIILAVVVFFLIKIFKKIHPVVFLLLSAVVGIVLGL